MLTPTSEPARPAVLPIAPDGIGLSSGADAVAGINSQKNEEAFEALLKWQAPPKSIESVFNQTAPFDNHSSTANEASTLAVAFDTQPLAEHSSSGFYAAHSAANLLDSLWVEGESLLSAVATNTLFALWGR